MGRRKKDVVVGKGLAWFGCVFAFVRGLPLVGTDKYLPPLLSSSSSVSWRPVKVKLQNLTTTQGFFSCSAQNWPLPRHTI